MHLARQTFEYKAVNLPNRFQARWQVPHHSIDQHVPVTLNDVLLQEVQVLCGHGLAGESGQVGRDSLHPEQEHPGHGNGDLWAIPAGRDYLVQVEVLGGGWEWGAGACEWGLWGVVQATLPGGGPYNIAQLCQCGGHIGQGASEDTLGHTVRALWYR